MLLTCDIQPCSSTFLVATHSCCTSLGLVASSSIKIEQNEDPSKSQKLVRQTGVAKIHGQIEDALQSEDHGDFYQEFRQNPGTASIGLVMPWWQTGWAFPSRCTDALTA